MKIPTPTTGEISLYFHIPFCHKKCPYCHFFVIKNNREKQNTLYSALVNEISQKANLLVNKKIVSIYFGGGTPFLFQTSFIENILKKIYSIKADISTETEITIEANPEDITFEKVKNLKEIGINRFSVGVQVLDDNLLKILGRSHNTHSILTSLDTIYHCGIKNISIDLMYEIPNQTLQSWENTLSYIPSLPITHISLYNLTIEPNTAFFKKKEKLAVLSPKGDEAAIMLNKAIDAFEHNIFKRYEISAFGKNDYYSRHNVGYWLYRPFIGFGPSAFSYYDNKRSQNCCNFVDYVNKSLKQKTTTDFNDEISSLKKLKEALAISLRLVQGVDIFSFENQWGKIPNDTKKTIDKLHQDDYLYRDSKLIHLTDKGLLFYDSVASEII